MLVVDRIGVGKDRPRAISQTGVDDLNFLAATHTMLYGMALTPLLITLHGK
jgi:hypothetical protein